MAGRATIQGYTILRDTEVTSAEGGSDLIYPGGIVLPFIGAIVLNLGDQVYISADNTVTKSAVLADYNAHIGVVVGGDLTGGELGGPKAQYGARAVNGAGNMGVLVQLYGAQYVICDAAVPVGPIIPSVIVAGRVHAATLPADAGAGVKNIGRLLQAGGTAGDVRLAFIKTA